ncbi:ribosomal protein L2 [Cylindrobasidium torrendii FP15055 ss-10]|uniref:Ribosomal protein L2 n=1 Tax=Cylindrobasidium torrendii FP15055 ss-10 TaxID=1314674 RepID=A0A0D7B973_9AGAR|nr:ribosomal protein L2 [Cylindrobasidium torrendii FP15055 ss-10]
MLSALRTLVRAPLGRNYATAVEATVKKTTGRVKKLKDPILAESTLFKTYHPFTPGVRHLRQPLSPHLYEGGPVRALTVAKRRNGGRNNHGRITTRHRGGGHKQRVRLVDWRREEGGVWDVIRIEYDPGRSGHIALIRRRVEDADSTLDKDTDVWKYILATDGMRPGDSVRSFRAGIPDNFIEGLDLSTLSSPPKLNKWGEVDEEAESARNLALGMFRSLTLRPGNVLPLRLVPPGTVIHAVGLHPDGPALLCRSAGSQAQVMSHDPANRYTLVRLASGEVRKVLSGAHATIGRVSNILHQHRILGKAGRRRWLGWRPEVRGVAMNAKDHPHGGGRGRSKSNKHPVSVWGWGTQGTRTRKPGPKGPKNSNKYVVKERPRGVEKRASA